MDVEETARMLKGIPLFCNLDASKLKLLAFVSTPMVYEDGEDVFSMGESADCAYLIEDGEAEVFLEEDGNRVKVNHLRGNDVFGEMALFLSSGRSATVTAKGTLKALKIDGEMFLKMVTQNPDAALGIMKALSEKIIAASEQVARS